MNELISMLHQLEAAKFYGALEVKFEAGHITIIRKTESIKPSAPATNFPSTGGSNEFRTSCNTR